MRFGEREPISGAYNRISMRYEMKFKALRIAGKIFHEKPATKIDYNGALVNCKIFQVLLQTFIGNRSKLIFGV